MSCERRSRAAPAAQRLERRALLSAAFVADLNPTPYYADIYEMAPLNGAAIFATRESTNGQELYRSDGTAAGTALLADLNPGPADSNPKDLTVSGGKIFFSAADGTHGRELFETDGTPTGTHLVIDLAPGSASSDPVDLTDVNGTLFFVANGPAGVGIYKTDGTAAGTSVVKAGGVVLPLQIHLTNVNGTVFFRGYDPDHGYELWKADGTPGGTQLVSDVTPGPASSNFSQILNVNGTAYFSIGGSLYRSDGTAAGTLLVQAIPAATALTDLTAYKGLAVFHAVGADGGEALWRSDGTTGGTFSLHDTGAGTSHQPQNIAVSNGILFFGAYDSSGGSQLWASDGTVTGTTVVQSFVGPFSEVQSLTDAGGTLYFAGGLGSLWKTDGTPTGTIELGGSGALHITPAGTHVLFRSSTGIPALSVSDGTPGGTVLLKQFQASTQGSQIENLTSIGDKVLFTAAPWALQGGNPFTPYSLYASDGTQAGTASLGTFPRYIQDPTALNGKLYFLTQRSLEVSDGTPTGTSAVQTFAVTSPPPALLTAFGSRLYFGEQGLWASDGTAGGTVQLELDVDPRTIQGAGPELYFVGIDSQAHYSLWKSDGTAAGTSKVADLPDETPGSMAAVGNEIYFVISTSTDDQLWKSDGTVAGTMLVRSFHADFAHMSAGVDNLVAMNGLLYFHADDQSNAGLWSSDGTPGGTTRVAAFPPDSAQEGLSQLTVLGNHLFFAAFPPAGSDATDAGTWTLWESDGTPAGTTPFPGLPLDSVADLRFIQSIGGTLYFQTYPNGRMTLWRSDGTTQGTQVIATAQYAGENSQSPPLAIAGGSIFFQATNGTHGESLYTLPLGYSGPVAQISPVAGPHVGLIDQLTITFTAAVTGLTVSNLSLSRQDGPNLLTAAQTLTTSDGGKTWTLGNLAGLTGMPGDYVLTLHADDAIDGDGAVPLGGVEYPVTDASGNPLMTDAQARFSVIAPASVSGSIFNDANHNGVADPGETGLAGWTVFIDANGNGVPDAGELTATTDASGNYTFANLGPGNYVIRQVAAAGWRQTTQPAFAAVTLTTGQAAAGPVFGDVQVSTVTMDFGYLLTLAQHYGQSGTIAAGDVNGDGQVNFADLLLVAQNYGHTLAAGTSSVAATDTLSASSLLTTSALARRRPVRPSPVAVARLSHK